MTNKPLTLGPAQVYVPKKTNVQLASTVLSSLTYTASSKSCDDLLLNDINPPLEAGANYYVLLTALGEDRTNGGLTSTLPSPTSGPITIADATTDGIHVNISSANIPANVGNAFAMAVWLKKNSGDFQLQGYGYIDTSNGFNYLITCEPLTTAQTYTSARLYSATNAPDDLGDREPYTIEYLKLSPKTSAGLTVARLNSQVGVSPDTGPDINFTTARGIALRFQLLANGVKEIVQGNAGKFAQYQHGGRTYKQSNMSLSTAAALLTGNLPFKVILPSDSQRVAVIRIYLNTVAQSQAANNEETWGRDTVATVNWDVNTVSFDAYLQDVDCEINYWTKLT